MLDLSPENFPNYRALLFDLAQLWTPPEPPPSTPPYTTTTPADVAAAPAPASAPSATSDIAALRDELAELRARVVQLERVAASAPLPAPPPSPKPPKPPYIDVSQAVADSRWNAWATVYMIDPRYRSLPPSVAQDQFARHNGLSIREYRRWFSPHRTHPPGSSQDVKYRKRISEALERLPKPCVTQ
jgi:hypothetical protein